MCARVVRLVSFLLEGSRFGGYWMIHIQEVAFYPIAGKHLEAEVDQ